MILNMAVRKLHETPQSPCETPIVAGKGDWPFVALLDVVIVFRYVPLGSLLPCQLRQQKSSSQVICADVQSLGPTAQSATIRGG